MPNTYKEVYIEHRKRVKELYEKLLNEVNKEKQKELYEKLKAEYENFEKEYGEIRSLEYHMLTSSVHMAKKLLERYIDKFGNTPETIGSYLTDAISVYFGEHEPDYLRAARYIDTREYYDDYGRFYLALNKRRYEWTFSYSDPDSLNPFVSFILNGDPDDSLVNLMRVKILQEVLLMKLLALITSGVPSEKYIAGICTAADNLKREGKYNTLLMLKRAIDVIEEYRGDYGYLTTFGLKNRLYQSLMHLEGDVPLEEIKRALKSDKNYDKLRECLEDERIRDAEKEIERYEFYNFIRTMY
jgi:hypothetical protein